jgi:tryptophan halogenase
MSYTNASYKMSIKFTDFYNKDSGSFHYPFGKPLTHNTKYGLAEWQAKKAIYPNTPVDDYCRNYFSTMHLIENNKFSNNENGDFDTFRSDLDVAYHFEASLFGSWLKEKYCIPRGVHLISENVVNVNTSNEGIDNLILSSGILITADLFIDCTGWKSMLLGDALKEPFTSYSDILPNNRAWAVKVPYTDKERELEPYTNCTAIGNGWCWNVPLWSRLGTGYVYSDKFITQKENYIHMNPVVAGIVSQPNYYRLSSASDESPIKVLPLR